MGHPSATVGGADQAAPYFSSPVQRTLRVPAIPADLRFSPLARDSGTAKSALIIYLAQLVAGFAAADAFKRIGGAPHCKS